jgi:predicted PurR-regulated permease PerM
MPQETKAFEISWTTLWRILLFVLLVAVLFLGRQILLGLFLAIIISSGIEVVVNFLERHSIPRTLGVILIFLFGVVLIILLIYTVIPLIIVDLNSIFSGFDKSTASVLWNSFVDLKTSQSANALLSKLSAQFFSGSSSPLDVFSKTLGSFGLVVAVIVCSFYLSISRDGVERFIKVVLPADYEKTALNIYGRSRKKIGFWLQTQMLLSVIIGVSVWGALTVLGVKHAFILGIVAAVFEIVPFVGPILSGALAVLMALSVSVSLALYTLIAFLVIQQLESHILVPLLMRRALGLHPVIVIIAILIGAEVGGILGVLISVPAAAVFEEALDEWSSKKRSKEPEPVI